MMSKELLNIRIGLMLELYEIAKNNNSIIFLLSVIYQLQ